MPDENNGETPGILLRRIKYAEQLLISAAHCREELRNDERIATQRTMPVIL